MIVIYLKLILVLAMNLVDSDSSIIFQPRKKKRKKKLYISVKLIQGNHSLHVEEFKLMMFQKISHFKRIQIDDISKKYHTLKKYK